MSDIQEKILELMDLFDDDEVTTANKIPRPQSSLDKEAFDDFNIRNPLAGGGMLVQPSADGRRPGYSIASEKVINFAKQFKEINKDLPTQQEIMKGTGAGSSTIKRHLKEGVDFKKVLSPKETGAIGGKKSGEKSIAESGVIASDDKEGLKKLQTKVNKLNRVNNLKNKGIKFNIIKTKKGNYQTILSYLADTYREKLNKTKSTGSLEKLIKEFNKFRKTSLFKNYDKGTVMREAGIKSAKKQLENIGSRKLDVFKYLLNNKNATMEEIGKALKIKSGVVRKSLQGLYTDIYKRAADQGAVFLKNYNINQLDSVHDSIKNTEVPLKDRVKNLVIDAYKGDKNLKPILKKLDDFYALNKKIKKTQYGKFFAANLDHVVPLNFLRQLEEGADPFNLIKLRPIPEFLNQRAFKAQFDKALGQAYANRLKPGGKEALETIVNLQSYLPQEFGGITPDGKIIDYGAKPFSLKTDLSQSNFGDIYKRVFEFIKNPDLQDTFRESKVSFKNLLSQEKNIMKQSQSIDNLLLKLSAQIDSDCAGAIKQASKDGGRIGLQAIGSRDVCITKAKNYARDQVAKGISDTGVKGSLIKRIFKSTSDFVKSALDPKELFDIKKQFFSKGAIASLPIFDAAIAGYEALAMNKPVKEAVSNTLTFGSIPRAMGIGIDTPEVLQAKQLLQDPKLSPAGKEYAQLIIDQGEYEKLQSNVTGGVTEKFKNFKNLQNKIKNASTAGRFDYQSLLDETQAAQLAKDNYSPLIGSLGNPLKNRAVTPRTGTRQGPGAVKIDLSPITYQNFKPDIASKEDLENYFRAKGYISEDEQLTPEFYQQEFVKPAEFEQLMELPSFRGASEKFAGGGIAKIAGVDQGPPPKSGPNSQGLKGLFNRAKNI